ncbi:hypothetical protein P280DRAFT_441671 [Massarina eburnea CBS 473.64]|uniref:C2H2-type domain-containing protein n=1 Tax=Massarina eburnea CBS 473.64 TaxID=1395130 RepID=A0A6A6SDV4_9PLEO|nr:hypothetical protein P280DRAFT_441671 [Massarina eburnea CBS 473.64]
MSNRFAIFDEDGASEPVPPQHTSLLNQSTVDKDDGESWEEVGRGGAKKTKQLKTPAIRNDHPKPLPAIVSWQNKNRELSGSSQGTSPSAPLPTNQYGNYCGVCHYQFRSKASLLAHIKQHAKTHANFCNLCRRVFVDRNGLKNHLDNSQDHEIFCNLCLSAFKNEWALKDHFMNNYAVGHGYVCLTCLLGFKTQYELRCHLQLSWNHVKCDTCDRVFRNQDERDDHWVTTTRHKHCLQPGCDFDAPTQTELETHLENDHFQCEGCRRIFPSQTKLALHLQACTRKHDVPCPDCGKLYGGQVKLAEHMEKCFGCTECTFRTDTEEKLKEHIIIHTPDGTLHPCWACNKKLRNPVRLVAHLENCSSIPPTFLLTVLGKWYYSVLYMDTDLHAQIRRNEVNFDIGLVATWAAKGIISPFICRAKSCKDKENLFSRFSGLARHVESEECEWNLEEHLKLKQLKEQFDVARSRADSVAGSVG